MNLGALPSLDSDAVSRALSASTSVRASAQAMRRAIASGQGGSVRSMLSSGCPRRIDGFARTALNESLDRLPRLPSLVSEQAFTQVDSIANTAARADMARALVNANSLRARDVKTFCSGSMAPLTEPADEAMKGFCREVERLSKSVPALSNFEPGDAAMFCLGRIDNENIVGYESWFDETEFAFAFQVPEAVYGIILERFFKEGDGSIDRDALSALIRVGDLVTPASYMSPRDLLIEASGGGGNPMLEELLDALIMGERTYGLDTFLKLVENGEAEDVPDDLEPAFWRGPEFIRELAELYFKTTDFATYLNEEMRAPEATLENATAAVEKAPERVRDRLSAALELHEAAQRLGPEPGGVTMPCGVPGGFSAAFVYPVLMDDYANECIHHPLMEGGERSFIGVSSNVPESLRYHALQFQVFASFLHLVADIG